MARIRSVHPGLFTDESFVSVSMSARLLAIGIWTECDDQGGFEWKPITLKMRIMPADAVDVSVLLEELRMANMVKPYEAGGKLYGVVRNFCKYQRPKKPNSVHPIPADLKPYAGHRTGAAADDFPLPVIIPEKVIRQLPTGGELVGNRFPTSGGMSSQMEDGGWRKEEHATHGGRQPLSCKDDPPSADLIGDLQPPTPAQRLFSEGLTILARLTGKTEAAARPILGKLKKAAGDSCDRVMDAMHAATEAQPADPVPWLMSAIRSRLPGKAPVDGDRCGIAGWITSLPDVKDDPDPSAPDLRRWTINGHYVDFIADNLAEAARLPGDWRGNWSALAQWLREDLSPEAIRRAIERVAARPDYAPPRTLRFFDGAVRDTIQ